MNLHRKNETFTLISSQENLLNVAERRIDIYNNRAA